MDKPEFRVERGPAATDEAFAIGMAKLLEREGRTIAAAELRRLHAENERLKTMPMKYRRMEFNAQLQAENDGLRAQRDALLEALKYLYKEFRQHGRQHWPEAVRVRAAIALVEGRVKAVEGEKR